MISKLIGGLFGRTKVRPNFSSPYDIKASRVDSFIQLRLGEPVWTPRDYTHLAEAGYQKNSDCYSAISLIARSAKSIAVYGVDAADKPLPDTHPLVRLIRRPNPETSWPDFVEQNISYHLLAGNDYIERVDAGNGDDPRGEVIELWGRRPDKIYVVQGDSQNRIRGYGYKRPARKHDESKVDWQPWQILHLKSFHPTNDWYGMAPMEAAGFPIDISNESAALYKKLLQKGTPAGWIEPEGAWEPAQVDEFRRRLRQRERDNDWLFGQGIKAIHSLGFNPANARIIEGRTASKRDIGAVYRVAPEMLGDPQSKTFSNYREARKSLYTEAVIPALATLVDGLTTWLQLPFPGCRILIDKDSIDALAEDRDLAASRAVKIFQSGLVRRNEARAEMGFESVPEPENLYWNDLPRPVSPSPSATAEPKTALIEAVAQETGSYELKAFDLISEEAKEAYWKSFEGVRETFYDTVQARVASRFDEERKTVLYHFRSSGQTGALRAVETEIDQWDALYKSVYLEVSTDFGRRVLSSLKADPLIGVELKKVDLFTQIILDWIANEGAKRVVGVSQTTKDKIRHELAVGAANGESTFQLAKRLEDTYKHFSYIRAERIARTEVISASNLGSQTAAKSTGLNLEKQWISTFDRRTRSHHELAHGQTRHIDIAYDVMGEKLMFPGDSSHGATSTNLIQCRCTESYRVKR